MTTLPLHDEHTERLFDRSSDVIQRSSQIINKFDQGAKRIHELCEKLDDLDRRIREKGHNLEGTTKLMTDPTDSHHT